MEKIYGEQGLDLYIRIQVTEPDGTPAELTGATVTLRLYDSTGSLVYTANMNILDPSQGLVEITIPASSLADTRYTATVYMTRGVGSRLMERLAIRLYTPEEVARLYVQPADIESWLGIDLSISEGRLIEMILDKMDYIDRMTNTTWNGRVGRYRGKFSWARPTLYLAWLKGGYIRLKHINIREIVEIQAMTGDGYVTVYPGEWSEGRGTGDFWLDRKHGLLFIQHWFWPYGGHEFIVEYTYGRDDLPGHVREATLLLVARDILVNERRYAELARSDGLDLSRQLDWIDRRLTELLGMLRAPQPTFL